MAVERLGGKCETSTELITTLAEEGTENAMKITKCEKGML